MYGRLDSQNQEAITVSPSKKRSYFPSSSSSSLGQNVEHVTLGERTAVSHPHNHHRAAASSRSGMRHTGGEIVEVQGGHIVRATGRKDRHSKVCTAKGPRDRRVRLSAHTAIQFYDVQDRLGYDRPSKAVDWLMKKAKDAIDALAELPAWNPTLGPVSNAGFEQNPDEKQEEDPPTEAYGGAGVDSLAASSSNRRRRTSDGGTRIQPQQIEMGSNSSFLPPSLDSDSIADTIKSFFPIGSSTETANSPRLNFQNQSFPPPQDLRLSLQSLQDPNFLHHHHQQQQQQQNQHHHTEHGIFSGTTAIAYETPSAIWPETHSDVNRFQRMPAWNSGGDTAIGGSGGFLFNSPPSLQPFGGHNQFFSQQRGPLQSSNTQSIRAWIDPPSIAATSSDHHNHHQTFPFHPSSLSGSGFGSVGGFPGFYIPARIQGEDEEHDGVSDKPSSASSDSRH